MWQASIPCVLYSIVQRISAPYGMLPHRCCPQALTIGEKESLALYTASPAMYGYLINNWLQRHSWRVSLHKFAKEALLCLLESCQAEEVRRLVGLVEASTGRGLEELLRPRSAYMERVRRIHDIHTRAGGGGGLMVLLMVVLIVMIVMVVMDSYGFDGSCVVIFWGGGYRPP